MPLFSVIVPVYNAEKTLVRCLDSLKCQSEDSFEILMVENGSTDDSSAICQKYAKEDNRFHLITMDTNCGPSGARNAGLDEACGEYIAFVDSDDYVAEDYLSSLWAAFEEQNPDAVFFGYQEISTAGEDLGKHIPQVMKNIRKEEMLLDLSRQNLFGYTWIKAFRRACIGENRFPIDMNLYEDEVFACEVLGDAKRISVISRALYCYVTGNAGSLVGRTHPDYPQKSERVYRAWKALLENYPEQDIALTDRANRFSQNCMYYCYERDVDVADFIRALVATEFFAGHSDWTEFDRLAEKQSILRIRVKRAAYRAKSRLAKLLRR